MANLRDRLRRIQETTPKKPLPGPAGVSPVPAGGGAPAQTGDAGIALFRDWVSPGFQTLKRELLAPQPPGLSAALSRSLPAVIPDMARYAPAGGGLPGPEDLLFFDLETTGLSGGAGTVAFLAAFGRLGQGEKLRITQYLLLDYPGESDFLAALLGEFSDPRTVVVSYNGKSFDSQILKNRCLMHGIKPPEYAHADLLHPARRLWKRLLPGCSQGAVEAGILGIDRSGDIPGALAPEIWFSFLKTGAAAPLLGVCEHNRRDIAGLAAVFAAMNRIAAEPLGAGRNFVFDAEALALRWRHALRRGIIERDPENTGEALLRFAAEQGFPRAALARALDLLRKGGYAEGLLLLSGIAAGGPERDYPPGIRAAALRALAVDAEWRLGSAETALEFVNRGLELPLSGLSGRAELERRAERLAKKREAGKKERNDDNRD